MTNPTAAERIVPKHYECEDRWYSCPLSQGGCANDGQGKTCNCGRDELVQHITTALAEARREVWEEAVKIIESREFLPSIYGNGGQPCHHQMCSCYHIYHGKELLVEFRRRSRALNDTST